MSKHLITGDTAIRAIKPGDPRNRLSDGAGLFLLLFVKGGAHGWRFEFTSPEDGKRKGLSLGTYPATTLALARKKAHELREQLASGVCPSQLRNASKEAKKAAVEVAALEASGVPMPGTFEAVARTWWESVHCAKVSQGHAAKTLTRLEQDAFPFIGAKPLATLRAKDVLACAQRVVQRGAIETAHRLKDTCGQVFRFGVARGDCERDPVPDLKGALPPVLTKHHASIIEPSEVAALLRACDGYQGQAVTRLALALSPLLFLRPGELRHLEWAWVNWLDASISIPSEVMKRNKQDKASGAPHFVPLAQQAMQLLRELQPLTGQGRYLFPAATGTSRAMSENTVRSALRRLGYGNEDMSAHGFRAMARTMADERLGIAPEVIEAQLAHSVSDALGRAYNRTQFLKQRRELMQRWADYLDQLRSGAKVAPLARFA
ncbi:MAG: tyrosine-type recombinase/integrase [Burkholderiales bacterium]|jgi:integrase